MDIDRALDPPLVVNSLFNPDSTWRVRVGKAWAINEQIYHVVESKNIDNAQVYITSGAGEEITLAYDTNGFYLSPLKPRTGETYTLSVAVPGAPPMSSSVVLPAPVLIDTGYVDRLSTYEYLVTIEFKDPPGPTAYELNLYGARDSTYTSDLDTDDPDVHVETYFTPRNSYPDNGAAMGPTFWALDDRNFQGQRRKLTFRTFMYGGPPEKWFVSMRTLSHEWAQYRATSVLQQNGGIDPFAQPVQVYSNIDNGVGIFAGYSRIEYVFEGH